MTTEAAPSKGRRTEFELLVALDILGMPVSAAAKFGPGIDTILQARFGDLSLGQVIEYLVHKAEPGFDFKLSPPWDLLNKINLKNFVFEVDITNRRVGFQYNDIGFKFPLINMDRIEVWFSPRGKGGRKTVDVSLYGSFLGKDYNESPGLTWDVLNQPPPATPGKGAKYFDLEYLGLGQHITLRNKDDLLSMKSIIDALEKSYKDVDPAKNPLDSLTSFKFDSSSSWLIGTKFSALEAVTLSAIFNDPYMYGLRVALDGKRVGKLAGLEFEIVYKRINDHLGLYHFELKLPDVIRQIKAGQVNLTLPIIDLDVYTNGNFKIDIGFPANMDFSRSAAINFIVWAGPVPIPISGAAGLYFGVLSSESSTQVPDITNGTFAPVLVAGFGMRLGLGYSLQVGILDAGFFVGFFGIFEGALAFFQPNSPSTGKAVYFKLSATVGIMGHIWGTVNFVILKASVDIRAYASAQLVIEVHQPIEVVFEAGVSVKLRVKVLFIHITLSFHANIRKSFMLGSATPTVWLLASSQDRSAGVASRQGLRQTPQGLLADAMYRSVLSEDLREHASHHVKAMMAAGGVAPAKTKILFYLQPMSSAGLTDDRPPSLAEAPPLVVANANDPVINKDIAVTVAGHKYTTVADDTLAKIATATKTTLVEVAAGVATTAGLLTVGAVLKVPQGAGSYTIKDNDTLASIIGALPGAALLVEQVAMLVIGSHGAMWEALAAANATTTGAINAGVKIKSYATVATDTFTTIAAALGVTVPVLADDVKDMTDLLKAGAALSAPTGSALLDGGGIVVAAGDSLASISLQLLSPFEQLARSAFEWSVAALEQVKRHVNGGVFADGHGEGGQVTRSDLNAIYEHLTDENRPILLPTIVDMLTAQSIEFEIGALPPNPQNPQFGVFPMLPYLTATTQGRAVDYSNQPFESSESYRKFITKYFERLAAPAQPNPGAGQGVSTMAAKEAPTTPDSITANLFTDFFVVILRQIAQDAIDLYKEYRYTAQPGQTLAEIAAEFGLTDDHIGETNAEASGLVAAGTIIKLPDGRTAKVKAGNTLGGVADELGVGVIDVANAIAARPVLRAGTQIKLVDDRAYTIQEGDTLSRIAAERQVAISPEVAVARIGSANHDTEGFFTTGQTLDIIEGATPVESGETLRSIANRLQTTPFLVALAVKDQAGFLTIGNEITIVNARYAIAKDATIQMAVDALGVAEKDVYDAFATTQNLLHSWVDITFPGPKGSVTYKVQPNDTLSTIAQSHGVTVEALAGAIASQKCLIVSGVTVQFDAPLSYKVRANSSDPAKAETPQQIADTFSANLANVIAQPGNANALELTADAPVAFGLVAQVRSNESLSDFAGRFGLQPVDVGVVARTQTGLLAPGAKLSVSGGGYVIRDGDTLALIATRFNSSPTLIVGVNNNVDPCFPPPTQQTPWSKILAAPLPVGYAIALPDNLIYTVAANDTLQGIAEFFSVELDKVLIDGNMTNKGLLVTQAAVALPTVRHAVAEKETPDGIAQQYGLSVDRLVLANQGPGAQFGEMIIPDCQQLPLAILTQELQEAGDFDKSSGSLARFMMHGLRLPTPSEVVESGLTADGVESGADDPADLTLYPMYSVLGQQWAAPINPTTEDGITLGLNSAAVPGLVTFAGGQSTLEVKLTEDEINVIDNLWKQLGSKPPIDPDILSQTALPPYSVIAKRFVLGRPIPWSAPAPPSFIHDPGAGWSQSLTEGPTPAPPPAAGNPALYPFPVALRNQIDATPGVWVDELGEANATQEGILKAGVTIELTGGAEYVIAAGDTLRKIVTAHPPLTIAQLSDAIAETPQLLVPGATLNLPKGGSYTIRDGDTLMSVAYACGPSLYLNLDLATKRSESSTTETSPINGFGWATQVRFGIRRAPDPSKPGRFIPSVYEVFGAHEEASHDLQRLLDYVMDGGGGAYVNLRLLYSDNPSSTVGGLKSDTVVDEDIWLLKANLSTRTNPPQTERLEAMGGEDDLQDDKIISAATLAPSSARDFLTLLWEASITNTGGYYLYYRTAGKDGKGLPDQIFGQDPMADVTLLITVKETEQADSTIAVRSFHNAALVTQNIADANASLLVAPPERPIPADKETLTALADQLGVSVQSLGMANATTPNILTPGATINAPHKDEYVVQVGDDLLTVALSLTQPLSSMIDAIKDVSGILMVGAQIQVYPTWLTRSPIVMPGAAGFRLLRTDPDPEASNEDIRADALTAQEDAATQLEVLFNLVGYRLTGKGGFKRSSEGLPAGPGTQLQGESNHDQMQANGAPPWTYIRQLSIAQHAESQPVDRKVPGQDPYAGLRSSAQFGIQFQDTFGNRFLGGDGETIDIPILYHDELIGVTNWPALSATYEFGGASPDASLSVIIGFDAAQYSPSPGDSYQGVAQIAEGHQQRYREIYFQVVQDGVTVTVTTTVDGEKVHQLPYADFSNWAADAYAYLGAVAAMKQITVTTTDDTTMGDIATTWAVELGDVASANRSCPLGDAGCQDLLKLNAELHLRFLYSVVQNDTLISIAKRLPASWGGPSDPITVATRNQAEHLQPGVTLSVGEARLTKDGDTLGGIATAEKRTAQQIAEANAEVAGLLAVGAEFSLPAPTSAVTAFGDTLSNIAARYDNITVDALVEANASTPRLIAIGVHLDVDGAPYDTVAGDTFNVIAIKTKKSLSQVAKASADLAPLLAPNVKITVPTTTSHQVEGGDTLQSVAGSNQLALGEVAEAIAAVAGLIEANVTITIPAAHMVTANDTFTTVADVFGVSPAALGDSNSLTPNALAPGFRLALPEGATTQVKYGDTLQSIADGAGVLVTLFGEANADNAGLLIVSAKIKTHKIAPGDTLASIAAIFKISVVALVTAIADDKVIQPGSAASLPAGARSQIAKKDTLGSIASSHGTSAGDLATANASTSALLAKGAALTADYVTKRNDTLESVSTAFTLTVAKLAAANAACANLFPPESALDLANKDYSINVGDTFESISKQEQISVNDMGVTNPDSKVFNPGKTLNIPRHVAMGGDIDNTYKIKKGDTFTKVRKATKVTVESLALANQDLAGLIASSVCLNYKISQRIEPFPVTTIANDTLSTVTARVQAAVSKWREEQEGRPRINVTPGDLALQNADQAGLLVAGQLMLAPPADMVHEIKTPAALADYPRVVFPVTASLMIERPADDVDPRLQGVPGMASVTTLLRPNIAPDAVQNSTQESGAQRFAKAFQTAYADLKLATGSERGSSGGGVGSQNRFFAVQYDTNDFNYKIAGDRSYFFAPPPLQNKLWSSNGAIPIRPYVSGKGLGAAIKKTFSGIDLDTWGKDFLATMDMVLSPDYAVAAYSLDADAYQSLIQSKNQLAGAIRQSVIEILDTKEQNSSQLDANRDAAREALYQRLLISLGEAYKVDAIIQLPVTVTAPKHWMPGTAPRFYGQPSGATYKIPSKANLDDVAAHFSAPLAVLAAVAANCSFILQPGYVVKKIAAYVTEQGDTLQSIAGLFENTAGAVAVAAADVKSLIIDGVAILLASGKSYTTEEGDTFTKIAGKNGISVAALGADAAAVPGLLDASVRIPGPAYAVQSSDTLATVAAHVRASVADLAALMNDANGFLEGGAALDLVTRTYALEKEDTLGTAIDYLSLANADAAQQQNAIENFAVMNAKLPGIFAVGSDVAVQKPYTIKEKDTLAKIADNPDFDVEELGNAMAARTDVLQTGTVIKFKQSTYATRPGDSLDGIAALLGTLVQTLVEDDSVENNDELLLPGAVIALPGDDNKRTHKIAANDTLELIAEAIAAGPPKWEGVTPSWIVTTQLVKADLVAKGSTVSFLSRAPGFSMSDAKIALIDHDAHNESSLNILFSTASNAAFSNLNLGLSYQVNQLEYDIEDVPWADGYQSSEWLGYIIPFTGPEIGSLDVPIPLRVYPTPPSMLEQRIKPWIATHQTAEGDTLDRVAKVVGNGVTAAAPNLLTGGAVLRLPKLRAGSIAAMPETHTVTEGENLKAIAKKHGVTADQMIAFNAHAPDLLQVGAVVTQQKPPTLKDIRNYNFEFKFSYSRVAQDTLTPSWESNVKDNGASSASLMESNVPLPDALAQYADIAGGLSQDLARLTSVKPTDSDAIAAQAVRVLAEVAATVATGWEDWTKDMTFQSLHGTPDALFAEPEVEGEPNGLRNEVVRLRLHSGVNAIGNKEVRAYPLNNAARPHAAKALIRLEGYVASDGTGDSTHIRVDSPEGGSAVSASSMDVFSQIVTNLDVISTQNIWSGVAVARNRVLIATKATNGKFVYYTPEVRMPTKAVPLINYTDAFDMTSVVPIDGARPLANWLTHFFAGLMDGYCVKLSDTLNSIAKSQKVAFNMLVNAASNAPDLLVPGVKITVPDKNSYKIKQGDTLTSIATAESVDVNALAQANASLKGLLAAGIPICVNPISRNLRVSVDYGFDLASAGEHGVIEAWDDEHLLVRDPAYFRPSFLFNSAVDLDPTQSGLIKDLAELLGQWADKKDLERSTGIWVFDVGLYTTVKDQNLKQLPPLLEMTNIQLDRSRITPK